MPEFPATHSDLLRADIKAFAHLATVQPDGSPQVTPVWFDVHEGRVWVNTAKGRVKWRNMQQEARVALDITDPQNPYRYVQVRGRVVSITEEGADGHIDALAKKYLGADSYPFRRPGEVRVIFQIEPISFQTMG